ncbi:OLC1v1004795C1 [Oldenlandia corymbosa var. corymbosa]|uniref:OLC1v1004795C1 n=1 Tax=Oldenlandia corymbosa var. corymbosa TaxID=529605 RepID=A0AAV1DEE2_OLDCO|nr:OLC1v1004795C1 [Oldenlandia corymbosa var. corymbosa]
MARFVNKVASSVRTAMRNPLIREKEATIWNQDLMEVSCGQISMAVVKGNDSLEDMSRVEDDRIHATFIGVYDGYGRDVASKFVARMLIQNLRDLIQEHGGMSQELLTQVFANAENNMRSIVVNSYPFEPAFAVSGTCCLVGVIWGDVLFLAHVGNSRAVMGLRSPQGRSIIPA